MGQNTNTNNFGWNDKVSFVVGGGVSVVGSNLYLDPVVDKSNGNVIIQEASIIKPNLSVGITYTPSVKNVNRLIKLYDSTNKKIDSLTLFEYIPSGVTYALLINPISLSKLSDVSIANTVDLGLGVGYRFGDFSILGTAEFFSIRQARSYFIDKYKVNTDADATNDLNYTIGGQVQNAIDVNDNSIFYNKVAWAVGLKFTYSFSIAKKYYKSSLDVEDVKKRLGL